MSSQQSGVKERDNLAGIPSKLFIDESQSVRVPQEGTLRLRQPQESVTTMMCARVCVCIKSSGSRQS